MSDLSHALGDLAHLRPAWLQADLRRGRGDRRGNRAAHRLTPCRLLEGLGVRVRDAAEVVVLLCEGAGCRSHPSPQFGVAREPRQVAGQNLDLALAVQEHDLGRVADAYAETLEQAAGGEAVNGAVAAAVASATAEVGLEPSGAAVQEIAERLREVGHGR